jgi:HD-like signal output (HDOD) protein
MNYFEVNLLDNLSKCKRNDPWEGGFQPMTKEDLTNEQKEKIKLKLKDIPPLPNILHQIITALNDYRMSSKQIAKLASRDPVIVGKILQLVNSSFFGIKENVKSIDTAVSLLGFNNVKNFVLQRNISKIFKGLDPNIFSLDDFWFHSLASSVCANYIAVGVPGIVPSDVSTIALLHDIGKITMAYYEPARYIDFLNAQKNNYLVPSIIIEEENFGINHALLGSLLTESWNLPDEISSTILYHHIPPFVQPENIPENIRKSVIIVHFADIICKMCDQKMEDRNITAISDKYFHIINKKPPLELMLDNDIAQEVQQVKVFAQ